MPQQPPDPRRASTMRELLRFDLTHGGVDELGEAVHTLLQRSSLTADERIQLLGGALVVEALRPYWGDGRSPAEAHARLRAVDEELADAVEALAPLLLARAHVQEEAAAALGAVEALLRGLE